MSNLGGTWATAALRVATKKMAFGLKMVRSKLASASRPLNVATAEPKPVTIRAISRQPIHPSAWLRQQKRLYTSTVRRFVSSGLSGLAGKAPLDRCAFPISKTSQAVSQLTGRVPFACALRPSLTGGALPRTAGGYTLGGAQRGARYFSHTPAAPAQVVQQCSQAMRAFMFTGQRACYDGTSVSGGKKYRAVSATREHVKRQLRRNGCGSYVDFAIQPILTAISPLGAAAPAPEAMAATLNADGFLHVLSVDFARALKDLAAVMSDLKNLSGLGDLPITLEKGSVLRVRFPGVDAETVERLCDDVGVRRGVVGQDPGFDDRVGIPIALRFPFAPDGDGDALTSPGGAVRSWASELSEIEEAYFQEFEANPWRSSPVPEGHVSISPALSSQDFGSGSFEGSEGIYGFLEECDRAGIQLGISR